MKILPGQLLFLMLYVKDTCNGILEPPSFILLFVAFVYKDLST